MSVTTSTRSYGAANVVFRLDLLRGHFIYFNLDFIHLFYVEYVLIVVNDEHTLVLSCAVGRAGSFGGRTTVGTARNGEQPAVWRTNIT